MKSQKIIILILLSSTASYLLSAQANNFGGTGDRPEPPGGMGAPPEGMEPPTGGFPGGNPPEGMPPGGFGGFEGGFGAEGDHGDYAAMVYSSVSDLTYTSEGDEENAMRISGETGITLTNLTIEKTGGEAAAGDNSNFYGNNAAVLIMDESEVTFNSSIVTSDAEGANGIFSYGQGTKVLVNNTRIRTSGNSSGGVMVTGGGYMEVNNSDIITQGRSSAALRTDRGGGTLIVKGGRYESNGQGSPAVYSTADVSVSDAELISNMSEAVVVEGKNSVTLVNCTLTGNMQKNDVENLQNVMIYQSMSGDADVGKSYFSMTGGNLISRNGDMFYVTNTSCTIDLNNVELSLSNDTLLEVAGNDGRTNWGTPGENGGHCEMNVSHQTLTGNIIVDKISSLNLEMKQDSQWTGSLNAENNGGDVNIYLETGSRWILDGDSYINSFSGDKSGIETGKYTLHIKGDSSL